MDTLGTVASLRGKLEEAHRLQTALQAHSDRAEAESPLLFKRRRGLESNLTNPEDMRDSIEGEKAQQRGICSTIRLDREPNFNAQNLDLLTRLLQDARGGG